ncbi:MAG: hypothetical protein ACREBE_03040, partial [bacterium]
MRKLVYAALAVVTIAMGSAPARATTCSDLTQFPLPPLTFVPFDRTNPDTGKPYGPTDQITIEGTTMLAKDAFDALDSTERTLTSYGYTLRDIKDNVLSELGTCTTLMASQVEIAKKILADSSGPLSPSSIAERIQKAIDLARTQVPNWGELWDKVKDHSRDIYLPPVPTYSAPIPHPKRTELKPVLKARSWSWEIGSKSSLWVQALANLSLDASKISAKAVATAQMNGAVLGLWEGEILGASAIANVTGEDDKLADFTAKVNVVGRTVLNAHWEKKVLEVTDQKEFDVRHESSIRFAIGPIPCKGTIGYVGSGGIGFGYTVIPIQILAAAVPYVDTKLYAQVGVDIVIAGAGIGGEVTLINDHVTLAASASVTFEDQPSLVLELSGKNSVDCLSGNLYAFARIRFLFIKKTVKHVFYKWTGFKKETDLFNFRTTWGPDGVTAKGDLTAEDVMDVTADNEQRRLVDLENASQQRVFEVFDAVARDLNSADSTQITEQRLRHQS